MKRLAMFMLLVAFGVLTSACSENPLSDVGHVTNDWIGASPTGAIETTASTMGAVILRSAVEVAWSNDFLAPEPVASDEALQIVFQRRESGEKYVQASRTEIAGVLPGIAFPELLPEEIEYVSSQLLFDGDGTLANDYLAAFGMWTAEPYTVSRSVGQFGVLLVTRPDLDRSGCERFSNRDITLCETIAVSGLTAWRLTAGGEETVAWITGEYQYELFHRSQIDSETALQMATAMIPLAAMTPAPGAESGVPSAGETNPVAADG